MAKKRTKSKSKPTAAKKKVSLKPSKQNKIIFGSLLIVLSIALFFSFLSYYFTWQEDQSMLSEFANRNAEASNLLNKFGASVSHFFMYRGFGLASFAFPLLLAVTGLYLFLGLSGKGLIGKWIWGLTGIIWVSVALGFFAIDQPLLGGLIGYEMNDFLQDYTGKIGVFLILVFVLMVIMVRLFNFTPEGAANFFRKQREQIKSDFQKTSSVSDETEESEEHSLDLSPEDNEPIKVDTYTHKKDIPPLTNEAGLDVNLPEEEDVDISLEVEKVEEEKEEKDIKSEKLVKDFGEFDPKLELGNYKFPPLDLLEAHGASGGITINQEELEENKNRIVSTLKNYKIGIAQIKATIGPTVTLYEIVPEAGIRISKIKNLEDDIALSLAALGIRIIAPIPGKGTIGIEVPNKNATVVSMRSVIASNKFQKAEMELPIAFGKTISNETFVVDLAKMPHMLMAGATGQGKSVGLNAVITSLLYKKHPAEVKFVLVDPKKVELTLYNKIERHFLAKLPDDSDDAIITDNTKVINTLNSLCIEMDNRYELLKTAMVRNIKEYNAKFKARKLNPNDGHKFLPYIVLVIDEFADLIMTAGKEVETPIARLAQLARAIGIHLIIATQRPSVNVITGIIKANFPARIAFRVTSKIDSRTILDAQGADQLIGRGDMLFTQGNDVTRLQCAFVDTPEVGKITEYIGSQRAYPEAHLLPEYVGEESGTGIDYDISDRDAMFREAAEVIVTAQQGSASLIQRKLKLGYNRAGRIIDQLEAAGIVGPFEGSKARQVLVPDIYSLDQLLENESK
ncbi:DNA translocase FtsK [Flagellimonas iocasae]|uniref:DNA translocase FtsK n=1 Tax=Flagellimonas iocasae TaxID=2055905 RepID=A0ABW4XSC4_9FLAO